jgi:hypothetical protein
MTLKQLKKEYQMKTQNIVIIIFLAIVFQFKNAAAQETNDNSPETRLFQLSFVSPLGTNGLDSWKTTNKVSINIFGGLAGGLDGIEFGGFYNILKGDMVGLQFAGFANTVLGETNGLQIAGFSNINKKTVTGIQGAGFANVALSNLDGVQLSGYANVANGWTEGAQIAGFANITNGQVDGVQLSGFANLATDSVNGAQVSGFANVSTSSLKGIQASGFANISGGDVDGAQISGFVNRARKLKGVQIGIINIVDTIESGTPIGIINIVKNGYSLIELSAGDVLYGNLSYKAGIERFYSIIKLSYTNHFNQSVYGFGFGLGTSIALAEKHNVSIELSNSHLFRDLKDKHWEEQNNWLTKLDFAYRYELTDKISLSAGPSLNLYHNMTNNSTEILELNNTLYEHNYKNHQWRGWLGFNAGVSFNL